MKKLLFKYSTKSLIVITILAGIISGDVSAQTDNPSPLHFPTPKNIDDMVWDKSILFLGPATIIFEKRRAEYK